MAAGWTIKRDRKAVMEKGGGEVFINNLQSLSLNKTGYKNMALFV